MPSSSGAAACGRPHHGSQAVRCFSSFDRSRLRPFSSSAVTTTTNKKAPSPAAFRVNATTADPPTTSTSGAATSPAGPTPSSPPLRYEMVQGPLVKWTVEAPEGPHPPTAVLIHGILGSRRNLLSFAKRLSQTFPSWQFLLVDLRCHGQTANMEHTPEGDNNVVRVGAGRGGGGGGVRCAASRCLLAGGGGGLDVIFYSPYIFFFFFIPPSFIDVHPVVCVCVCSPAPLFSLPRRCRRRRMCCTC